MSIEFRERPTLEHVFQLEVRKSGPSSAMCAATRGGDSLRGADVDR
jgi:hypothetical protein